MPASETQVKTEATNLLDIFEDFRQWVAVDAKNYLGMQDTFIQSLYSAYPDAVTSGLMAARGDIASFLSRGSAPFGNLMLDMGAALALSGSDLLTILDQLFIYYAENSRRVKSRQFTRGTPTAYGSNVGNGIINRLTTDAYGFAIETGFAEALKAKCTKDQQNGANKHEEEFTFEGTAPPRDILSITGTGAGATIPCISAAEASKYLANPSWESYQGTTAVPTSITNWTPGSSIANFEIDTANYYRDYEGATVPASLVIKANDYVSQAFSVRRATFLPGIPYYFQIAYNREIGAFTGDLKITCGSVTKTVSLAAQTGWNILRIDIGANNWYRTFKGTNPVFKVEVLNRAGGSLRVDDMLVAPFRRVKGTWYAPVGGSTKFLRDDYHTWTDTEVGAVINFFLALWFDRYLPPTTSVTATTWADPV